ncbi:M3 family metallopeptidase [Paucibacter sp. PLA-PC-4]|uniref:M3 family metallopeptidase n=1 Tax=Paucibacter sp. PLA-PC-4 TaxID=2993655 RepID=UPI00224B1D79|nr:M3 family metallopeptidase [Paucibacter sp. PLA-PC-4]MCX2863889.1 M3 family metallopeptidase [Paucibacter sp. PLA-PC-4]
MMQAQEFFDALNRDYLRVHKTKEDLFWSTYMATSEDHAGFAAAEARYKDFISDPARLAATRAHLAAVQAEPAGPVRDALLHGLQGWLALFEAHIVDKAEGQALMRELIAAEAALFAKNKELAPTHLNERGEREVATLSMLATNMATNPSEAGRRSAYEAYGEIERWVLDKGFLDLVRLRNRFARTLGFANYFELKLRKNERMTPAALFEILNDFVDRTQAANDRALAGLVASHGEAALLSWNLRYFSGGDVVRRMDEYMPFGPALRRWVQSFRRLGISYRGATMQLDLLAREGKYQNGFCHGPIPAYVDESGSWVAGQINFTAEAKPDQVGSGLRAINTLFHEGGHAAHFANVVQNSPCFSQEFAPTSMAYAETQSMFCDSLLNDADWLKRYARNAAGEAIPDALIRERIASQQPMRAFDERAIAVVPYFEAALYAMDDAALTAESVLALARATELRIQGVAAGPRPLLAIPHLLNQESAASYQGYLLAHMAVYQTRAHFLREHGYLADNPAIGPALAEHYWAPGNSIDHDATLRRLTGEGFSARYLAQACNESVDEAWASAQQAMAAASARGEPAAGLPALDATIRIVHGAELLADSSQGEDAMCERFERWVGEHYVRPALP